jgi:hypothetical protein
VGGSSCMVTNMSNYSLTSLTFFTSNCVEACSIKRYLKGNNIETKKRKNIPFLDRACNRTVLPVSSHTPNPKLLTNL